MTNEQLQAFKTKHPKRFAELQRQAEQEVSIAKQQKKKEYNEQYYTANKVGILAHNKQQREVNREKRSRQDKLHYETNKEKILEHDKLYYIANREKILKQRKQQYGANREEILEQHRLRYLAKRDKILEYERQCYQENRERKLTHQKQYYRNNRKKRYEYDKQHSAMHQRAQAIVRTRRVGAEGSYSIEELRSKFAKFDNKCVYCGDTETLTADHIIPLSRGGSNYIDNVVSACFACNNEKRSRTAKEFFDSIEAGEEEGVMTRRYLNDHPEIREQFAKDVEVKIGTKEL